MAQQPLARIRGRHGLTPAGPTQQRQTGGALERRDLLADGRLRVPELVAGATERARADYRLERGEVANLDAR